MDRRELIGPEHLNRAGTRQEEGVGILPLSARFLLFSLFSFLLFFFFFTLSLIPLFQQEVIGIGKKNRVKMEEVVGDVHCFPKAGEPLPKRGRKKSKGLVQQL